MTVPYTCICIFLMVLVESQKRYNHGIDLPSIRPYIIAHRGSSGMRPEHTVDGYYLAVTQGADIIECDLAITKDLHFVCMHESSLNLTTNVATTQYFTGKNQTYFIPEINATVSDWFTVDFTLEELMMLKKRQRHFRDPRFNDKFGISTVAQFIDVAMNANRPIGMYIETKQPQWFNSLPILRGTTIEELLVNILRKHGFTKPTFPCFLQSFSIESLSRLSGLTKLPLVFLTKQILTTEQLTQASKFVYGIGPSKDLIVQKSSPINGFKSQVTKTTNFIERCHKSGLKVHAFTFRNEDKFLAWDYGQDPYMEYKKFYDLDLDGYFTDFSATLSRFLNVTYSGSHCEISGYPHVSDNLRFHLAASLITLLIR